MGPAARARASTRFERARRRTCWRPTPGQAQFGIVQGSVFPDLRVESAERTVAIGFEAYAIGGLSVGEPIDVMHDIVGPDGAGAARRIARVT